MLPVPHLAAFIVLAHHLAWAGEICTDITVPAAAVSRSTQSTPTPLLLECESENLKLVGCAECPEWSQSGLPRSKLLPWAICIFPSAELDLVSEEIRSNGVWEVGNHRLFTRVFGMLRAAQEGGVTSKQTFLFVDAGAFLGWFSLAAASHGLDVVAFEPMPLQRERFRAGIMASHPLVRKKIKLCVRLFLHPTSRPDPTEAMTSAKVPICPLR